MNIEFNHENHVKDGGTYTRKTYPLHRDNNVAFDDMNGIVTWADEIDYGRVRNFGWPNSNTNIEYTYASLLQAINDNFQFLWNEIQALKNNGTVVINLTRSNYQGTSNPSIITASVQNGNANETSWRISQKPGTTAWLTADTLGTIPPLGISINYGNPNLVNTTVNNASAIFIGSFTGTGREVYDSFQRLIQSISILNNHGSNFTGDNDSADFKVNIDPTVSKTYTAIVTATNQETTETMEMTRTVNGLTPTSYLWQIAKNEDSGAIRGTSINNNADATFTYSEYGIQFTIKNNRTSQATLICPENNTGSDIEFYVRCRVTYGNDSANYKSIKCVLKAQSSEGQYYWYGGQTDPEIDTNVVTEAGVSGWRLVTDGYEYNSTINPIYDQEYKTVVYCALPKDGTVKIKDDQGTLYNPLPWPVLKDITFNGIEYTVYKAEGTEQFSGFTIFK